MSDNRERKRRRAEAEIGGGAVKPGVAPLPAAAVTGRMGGAAEAIGRFGEDKGNRKRRGFRFSKWESSGGVHVINARRVSNRERILL